MQALYCETASHLKSEMLGVSSVRVDINLGFAAMGLSLVLLPHVFQVLLA